MLQAERISSSDGQPRKRRSDKEGPSPSRPAEATPEWHQPDSLVQLINVGSVNRLIASLQDEKQEVGAQRWADSMFGLLFASSTTSLMSRLCRLHLTMLFASGNFPAVTSD
jgi:hypothetical protein